MKLNKIFLLSQLVILIYILIIQVIFYHDLKVENKILESIDIDAVGITSFTLIGLFLLYSVYQIFQSFSSK